VHVQAGALISINRSSTTHTRHSTDKQQSVGKEPGLFRVSEADEHTGDIIFDFEQAFRQVI